MKEMEGMLSSATGEGLGIVGVSPAIIHNNSGYPGGGNMPSNAALQSMMMKSDKMLNEASVTQSGSGSQQSPDVIN